MFLQEVASLKAVDGVSFEISRGETLGLVGEKSGLRQDHARSYVVRLLETAGEIAFKAAEDRPRCEAGVCARCGGGC